MKSRSFARVGTGHPVIKAFALDIGSGVLVDGNATDYRLLWLDDRSGWEVMGSGNAASLRNVGKVVEVGLFLKDYWPRRAERDRLSAARATVTTGPGPVGPRPPG